MPTELVHLMMDEFELGRGRGRGIRLKRCCLWVGSLEVDLMDGRRSSRASPLVYLDMELLLLVLAEWEMNEN